MTEENYQRFSWTLYCRALTQDWVFLYKKRSSSTRVIGPELPQRNPTAYVVHRVPNFEGPQHKTKTKFALLVFSINC